ncbi:hypothetical protein CK203_049676 [Vitis vinifera]|uniref:Uncharacterized protein n=1 Tax=Vitis vinifera TaxID=29760 RepID=A0A438GWP7_VITVI|nr:hypothetical protein CK203_049676 [Vitis vinifera]
MTFSSLGTTRVKCAHLQALQKEFEILHMKVGEFVNEYFAQTLTIANRMKANCENKGDVAIVNVLKTGPDRPVRPVQPSTGHHSGSVRSFGPD